MMTSVVMMMTVFTLITERVTAACSTGCTDCSGNKCRGCESSYYLSSGSCFPCPDNCNTCNNDTHCTSCKPTQWDIENVCVQKCHKVCLNTECHDENGFCKTCEPGKYGPICRKDCNLCEDGLCDIHKCTFGCKSGYYEKRISTEYFCVTCPENCVSCIDIRVCTVCNEGYYVSNFVVKGITYGYCYQCDIDQSCKTCQMNGNSAECTECYEGYIYNDGQCIKSNITCSEGCLSNCDENGSCLGDCKAGWTGDRCSDSCASMCLTCEKTNANTCKECKGDFYTVACSMPCHLTCAKEEGKHTCRLNDGYCNNGCENKFWGPFCNQSCSKGCLDEGVSEICNRDKGICYKGCSDGYTGDLCDMRDMKERTMHPEATSTVKVVKITETTETDTNNGNDDTSLQKEDNTKIIITGVGAGGGVVFLVLMIHLIYCFVKRHVLQKLTRQKKDCKEIGERSTYYNITTGKATINKDTKLEENNYESLQDARDSNRVYTEIGHLAV